MPVKYAQFVFMGLTSVIHEILEFLNIGQIAISPLCADKFFLYSYFQLGMRRRSLVRYKVTCACVDPDRGVSQEKSACGTWRHTHEILRSKFEPFGFSYFLPRNINQLSKFWVSSLLFSSKTNSQCRSDIEHRQFQQCAHARWLRRSVNFLIY